VPFRNRLVLAIGLLAYAQKILVFRIDEQGEHAENNRYLNLTTSIANNTSNFFSSLGSAQLQDPIYLKQ
jgi:hypothetical protein